VNDAAADPAMEAAVKYVAACEEVLAVANTCLEAANPAVAARRQIAECQNGPQGPGTPIAIRNFTRMAEEKEEEFAPLYAGFEESRARAREAAAQLLAAKGQYDAEMVLMFNFEEGVLDNVATVKVILRAGYGPTPARFIQGVKETNELLEDPSPEAGNIYTPAPPTARICPWCAETIKPAAVLCRFCGRDVEPLSNAGQSS
jgi:hypothetical protein